MSLTPSTVDPRPRVGIPWRTSTEEQQASLSGRPAKTEDYVKAVERAGGEGVIVPLRDVERRNQLISTLNAFVLPGSPHDVDPREYGEENKGSSGAPDRAREETDRAILELAFAQKKPVLAICYGFQHLNVYLQGTLVQDIHTELQGKQRHRKQDPPRTENDPEHGVILESGSCLAGLAGGRKAVVNSSHHQAVKEVRDLLKVTARSEDGIIEGIEWMGDANWVVGVQWHPERRPPEDVFAKRLFEGLVSAAKVHQAALQKT